MSRAAKDQKFASIVVSFNENIAMLLSGAAITFWQQRNNESPSADCIRKIVAKDVHVATLQGLEFYFLLEQKQDGHVRFLDDPIMQKAAVTRSQDAPVSVFDQGKMLFRNAIDISYERYLNMPTSSTVNMADHEKFLKIKDDLIFAHHVTNYLYATQEPQDLHFYELTAAALLTQKIQQEATETIDPTKREILRIQLEPLENYFKDNDFAPALKDKRLLSRELSQPTIYWIMDQHNKNETLAPN
jgi:hypothetical protein